jgi:hypothetical protein
MESESTTVLPTPPGGQQQQQQKTRLVDVPIPTQQDALQLLVTFVNLAQKRGAYTLDESAKIWECIKMFQ